MAPSSDPYNLLGKANSALLKVEQSEVFYNETLRRLLGGKVKCVSVSV